MIVSSRATATRPSPVERLAPPLTGGARIDVCIVGAGLAGMIAAYLLARDKRSVIVIDEGPIGGTLTSAEMAQVDSVIERPYSLLEERFGKDGARLAAQSFAAAADAIEAIVRRERIACEFERLDGYRIGAPGQAPEPFERERDAARHAGVREVELLHAPPVESAAPAPTVRYPGQVLFHPLKLVAGLARAITREGGRIHCGVRAKRVEPGSPSTIVTTAGHRIESDFVVTPAAQYSREGANARRRAHLIGLRVPRGAVTRALYWEARGMHPCARLRAQGTRTGEVLLVAGHGARDDGGDDAHHDALEGWARERFPFAGEVLQRLSGDVPRTPDMFAFAGRKECESESAYVGDGGWGTGMARVAITGMMIKDFVDGARVPWASLYMPSSPCAAQPESIFGRDFS